ncbi:sigma-70 family RNA polymerase sigma factor [endosymbiont of Lamellibrachia barhami]|uniref:sigma-70 family RNA polymerase sigma factor n=1 Tax=endosymbiont of Lamellibrachia barhami TaxID=205975 RepID=UPI0015AAE41A|nr:sigma-70 family RNA polymerase sigma factor [endosymbiont of Lamellibrachia barhami]
MSISEPERWLEEHGSALYSFAFLHVRDGHRAEDLVQETLLAALKARERFQGNASLRTWLTGILKHKIMDEFRRQSREAPTPNSPEDAWDAAEARRVAENFTDSGRWSQPLTNWGDSEQDFFRDQFWSLIEQCLTTLSPRAARLFVLRELWEMETGEVCKELAITPTNLWTTLHRARLGMRQCLEKNLYA